MQFQPGDPVAITCEGNTVTGKILKASDNGHSLALSFESAFAGHFRIMAVTRDSDGIYRTLDNRAVILRPAATQVAQPISGQKRPTGPAAPDGR
jgi:hypothetical protein